MSFRRFQSSSLSISLSFPKSGTPPTFISRCTHTQTRWSLTSFLETWQTFWSFTLDSPASLLRSRSPAHSRVESTGRAYSSVYVPHIVIRGLSPHHTAASWCPAQHMISHTHARTTRAHRSRLTGHFWPIRSRYPRSQLRHGIIWQLCIQSAWDQMTPLVPEIFEGAPTHSVDAMRGTGA